jgi:hypothetical protein
MNEKTRIQIEEMKKQTIGVEVEMYNITREKACRTIAAYYGTEHTVRYIGGGYYAWACKDNQGREWKITRDSSIHADRDEEKTEMGTPILTYSDMEDLQKIIRSLRKAGAKSDPAHMCGVHIHIGLGEHSPQTLRNLANIMASHESLLISALRLDRNRINRYCNTVDKDFLKKLNRRKPQTMDALADIWYDGYRYESRHQHYNSSRYHMLNYHACFTHGTVEFRCFQFANPTAERKGGLHAGELKSYIQLCLALSQMAMMVKTASPKEPQVENPKYAMRTWLLRLGFIGDEFATARELLTKNLEGDTAFRHGRNAA